MRFNNLSYKLLTNLYLFHRGREMDITHFRGILIKYALPARVHRQEYGVVNLDDTYRPATL